MNTLDCLIAANLLRIRTLLDSPVPLVGETDKLLALADELSELLERKEDTADEQTD